MSDYYLDIIDTTDGTKDLIIEQAAARSLVLDYKGSDAKDALSIIGSSFTVSLLAPSNSMGHFLHLFTGDETRYRFEFRELENDTLLWQGFLVPDTYQEPYTTNNPFVRISATDGLGRLKGKYLPDDFYTKEISVIELIQTCLSQTGLSLDLMFAPAIQHISFQKYHNIYIDGELLVVREKKQNCYTILTDLLQSMVCICFQSLGKWYVEGLNVRHLSTVVYDKYLASDNTYVGEVEIGRYAKVVDSSAFVTPMVSMVPVYNKINVEYTIEQPKLPTNITQETNDGWVSGRLDSIYADAFFPHEGESFMVASAISGYSVYCSLQYTDDLYVNTSPNRRVSLIAPIYVNAGQEVGVEIAFVNLTEYSSRKIEVVINNNVAEEFMFYNNPELEDEEEREVAYFNTAVVIQDSGYIDINIYRITQEAGVVRRTNANPAWQLKTFKINIINQDESFLIEDEVNDNYSLEKDIDLVYADEYSGLNKTFLLAKLNESSGGTYQQILTVFNEFESKGFTYLQTSLKYANLVDTFKDYFYVNGVKTEVLEVVYNWLGSTSEHMIKIAAPTNGATVHVLVTKNYAGALERGSWQSWTDAVYRIENERYGKIVANVYRRMFLEPYEKIDLSVNKLLNFNDILMFTYIDVRRYVPINLSIDLDKGTSTVTMVLNYYDDNSGGVSTNISPILNMQDNFCIPADQTTVNLTSDAYDPDGFIVSRLWEIITGTGSITLPADANITVTNLALTTDQFVFRHTVTDNGGAVVSKDITVCRTAAAEIEVTYSCGQVSTNVVVPPYRVTTADPKIYGTQYQKGVTFLLDSGVSTDFNFNVRLKIEALLCSVLTLDDPLDVDCAVLHDVNGSGRGEPFVKAAGVKIFKNGLRVADYGLYQPDNLTAGFVDFTLNASDTVLIMIGGYKSGTDYVNTKVSVESIIEQNGGLQITNDDLVFYLTTNYTLQ